MQHLLQSSDELYMPTKKRRVSFIPRNDVLDLINKLSLESNLSNSKVVVTATTRPSNFVSADVFFSEN